ncbi:MAG TPA: TetR/AcrR family transcriptional regulator [Marmoricola sp.]|jgi:AcrR family transcriptional regulator|nr:TetR/AcrR family transcriptional regulator [Marmoricola sp.]
MTTIPKRRGRPPSGGREDILRATQELIAERGMAKLTTREVAERAGVSEGSVFYHFEDRFGLLKAAFESALDPLHLQRPNLATDDLRSTITRMSEAIAAFLASGLDVMMAAHSDAALRESLHGFMADSDYGPHRGIAGISAYIRLKQQAGEVRADIDAAVVASLIVSDALMRAAIPKLIGNRKGVQSRKAFVDTVVTMLEPPVS